MGLGIPEAMLVSAAVGGASAAATGKDPLTGALLGAGGSVLGPMVGEAAGNIIGTAAGETAAASTNLGSLGQMTTGLDGATATNALSGIPAPGGITNLPGGVDMFAESPLSITPEPSGVDMFAESPLSGMPEPSVASATTPYQQGIQSGIGATPPQQLGTSFSKDFMKAAMENKAPLISAAIAGQAAKSAYQPGIMSGPEDDPNNPLRRYRFDPSRYRPILRGYAQGGGISSLPGYDMMVGETPAYADGGGISDLGTYSDGGRMLKGAGDGMSDSIPGVIGGKRPARLADGEFVVPADVVSHLGNGSTDAGAKQLYKMMDKVRAARTGTRKQGRQINPRRFMPA